MLQLCIEPIFVVVLEPHEISNNRLYRVWSVILSIYINQEFFNLFRV